MSSPAPTSPPATNTTSPPPATPSAPPPATPAAPPPATPATPAAPPPSTPSPPPPAASSPPPSTTPSPPAPTPPTSTNSPPPPSSTTPSSPPPPSTTPATPSTSPPPPRSSSTPTSPPPPSSTTPSRSSPPPPPGTPAASPSGSNGLSTGVVVGIAIGAVGILVLFSILCICASKKKRRRRDDDGYYGPPPPLGPKDNYYGSQSQQRWQQNPPPPDHFYQPSPPPAVASRPPQQAQGYVPKPPPPLPFSSSSGSGPGSNNYSGSENPPAPPGYALGFSKSTFTYDELALATDGFNEANLLGQGGFGYVHKGVLPNGQEVAVKQLKAGSGQGEREFQAEVDIISRVHHKHLVSLVGYCMAGTQRMLVYEFVPNNTLEFHLHGKGRPTMDWETRLKIALGSAKGLAYLHEDCHPKIIHRDIKTANILVDYKFEAKVADFGLAKFTSDVNTHVSTRVMGTFGYLAPEYAASGKLTEKSDVFSFGVMLLELITGRRPVDSSHSYMDDSLVDWARPLLGRALEDRSFDSVVDPKLTKYNEDEMARLIACAAACVRHSARRRPRMSQVVRALEGDVSLADLNEGIRPGQGSMYSSHESSDYDTSQYNEDMKKMRKMALGSQGYGASGEYSGPTSTYGMYQSTSSSEGQTTRELDSSKIKRNNNNSDQGFSGTSLT